MPNFVGNFDIGGNMKHRMLRAALADMAAGALLAGCATTVDWGGPLVHYRYHYDSRPVVYSAQPADTDDPYYRAPATYDPPVVVERPVVSLYHHDDDD
jgi:hypothetical protein